MFVRAEFDTIATAVAALIVTFTFLGSAVAQSPSSTFVAEEAADGDLFGAAVDLSAGLVAVGAQSTDLARDDAGAVHLFEASDGGLVQIATLTAGDGELADAFGASVAIGPDVVLVGAPGVVLTELNEGAAYLFEREGDAWREVAKLRREAASKNDMFGAAVGFDGGVAVIGAPGADVAGTDSGAAMVYERFAGAWEAVATLVPAAGASGERFGSAVAVDGERILIGASGDVSAGEQPGSAYLFERASDGWHEVARWSPSDGKGGDAFGDAVALAGDLALIGARFADLAGSDEGAAYLFERTSDGWQEAAKLTLPEPSDRDQFGHSVALAGDVALVGAPRVDEPDRDSGALWAFVRGADGWGSRGRLSPAAPDAYDEFGTAVAADGSVAVVGAPQDIPEGESDRTVTGTATLFRELR